MGEVDIFLTVWTKGLGGCVIVGLCFLDVGIGGKPPRQVYWETSPRDRRRKKPAVGFRGSTTSRDRAKPPGGLDVRAAEASYSLFSKEDGQPEQRRPAAAAAAGFPNQRALAGRDIKGKFSLRLARRGEERTAAGGGLAVCLV